MCTAQSKKKLSCVQEVERIKQRREERRAHNQARKDQHDQDYDTSTPNWEFDAMIRSEASLGWMSPVAATQGVTPPFDQISRSVETHDRGGGANLKNPS